MSKQQITWASNNTTYSGWGRDLGNYPIPTRYAQEFIAAVTNRYKNVSSAVFSSLWGSFGYVETPPEEWVYVRLSGTAKEEKIEEVEKIYKNVMNSIPIVERELFKAKNVFIEGVWE